MAKAKNNPLAQAVPEEPERAEPEKVPPARTDPGWTDHVLSLMAENEVVQKEGKTMPRCVGLRRVFELLNGPPLENCGHTIQAPTPQNGGRTVVEWTLSWIEHGVGTRRVSGLGDAFNGNCEPEFARFAATAATRAEATALRRALLLNVVAAEEITSVPVENFGNEGLIADHQRRTIDVLCQRNDINALKLLSQGKPRQFPEFTFTKVDLIPKSVAAEFIKKLSDYQGNQAEIPPQLKGYVEGWY